MLRRFNKQESYDVNDEETMSTDMTQNVVQSINQLMRDDERRTRLSFTKVAPVVDEIFSELANRDVRFEFDPPSLDDCHCNKLSVNAYSLLCVLKELPDEQLRLEGSEADGALTVRLSRKYEERYDRASWEDICLPGDEFGCRYFSTTKLRQVLTDTVDQAIEYLKSTWVSGRSAICKIKNNLIILDVKVENESLTLNLLPTIELSQNKLEALTINDKITKIFKYFELVNTERVYVVAKPAPDYPEKLWRINVNDIETKLLRKLTHVNQCASHCLFLVNLLNEKCFADGIVTAMLPSYYIRLGLLAEFLKFPHKYHWQAAYLAKRVDGVLRFLENHLAKGQLKNVFTGVNVIGGLDGEILGQLFQNLSQLRNQFREFLLSVGGQ